jgi:hypothetical protein
MKSRIPSNNKKANEVEVTVINPMQKKEGQGNRGATRIIMNVQAIGKAKMKAHRAAETAIKARKNFRVKEVTRNKDFSNTTRQNRRHSITRTYTKQSLQAIPGEPEVEFDSGIFFEMFAVHIFFPVSYFWIWYAYGSNGLDNLGFSFSKAANYAVTHVPFSMLLTIIVWGLADFQNVWKVYYGEFSVALFMHFSRVLAISVKYAYVDRDTLRPFLKHHDFNEAVEARGDLMLATGWLDPTYKQWIPIVDEAEHAANLQLGLNRLTDGHGLAIHMQFVGKDACRKFDELTKDYVDLEEIKRRGFSSIKSEKEINGTKYPVLECSIGLILIAFLNSERAKSKNLRHPMWKYLYFLFFPSPLFVGMLYRSGVGLPLNGGHSWGWFFVICASLVQLLNFSALLMFLEVACSDYKRREILLNFLKEQLKPQIIKDENKNHKITPELIDLKLGNNSIAYLSLRQTVRMLGKKYRLRLQWLVSYAIILQVIFLASFLTIAFGQTQALEVEHYFGILLTPIISIYVLRALTYADVTNAVPSEEQHFIRLQIISSHSTLNLMLQKGRSNISVEDHRTSVEIEKNLTAFLSELCSFINEDDERNPIKILNLRADYKLLQAFIFSVIGFLVTLIEVAGIDLA